MAIPHFIHLRARSAYSLLESSLHINQIKDLCIENNMPAICISDSNLFGALEFSETMSSNGIQPLIGATLNVSLNYTPTSSSNPIQSSICLIAMTEIGYKNLLKLSSYSFQKNNALFPFVTIEEIYKHNEGLFFLTGGDRGTVNNLIKSNGTDQAIEYINNTKSVFNERLFIEIQRSNSNNQSVENKLIDIAYDRGIPIVATNDIFFESRADHEANDILQCITNADVISNPNRKKISQESYFKNQEEMFSLFEDLPEALENSVSISMRCTYRPTTLNPILPMYVQEGSEDEAKEKENHLLIDMANKGFQDKISKFGTAENYHISFYQDRLDNELSIILDMDYAGYFLIVSDIINWSKNNDIPVGPGRGSGAGSLVAWSLGITDLDPIKFNLVFERFLNPHRISMPDFDIDFCPIRRDEVINYIKQRYGNDRVAQIITFGKLQARAVIRDVGRVMEIPYGQVDSLCRLIPNNPANPMTLSDALSEIKEIGVIRKSDETIDRLLKFSLSLEGLYRHASTHAAGVVISNGKLEEYVPLYMDQKTNSLVTQFNMKWVEQAGLVKFDILGLKTLSVISECCKQLEAIGKSIDITSIDFEDEKTLKLFRDGETSGVFQFESSGMKDLLVKAHPNNFEDLIALIALFRPGPMENIPQYLESKNTDIEIEDLHELINPIIADTYGVIIYQEQVIQIAQKLAGYSLGEADLLRRAMGKKIKSEMDAQRDKFINGASSNGVDAKKAEYIFDLVDKFAGYGFNKAHSAAYALIAFQTAYLKANYPLAFMSALLTLDIGNIDKVSSIISETKRMKIEILPPSINYSSHDFLIEGESIRFSLSSIKNVGAQAVENICTERSKNGPYADIQDFISRIDSHFVNKRALEGLIMAGAFDEIEQNRALLMENVEILLLESSRLKKKNLDGQTDIFAGIEESKPEIRLPEKKEWTRSRKLAGEFEFLGSYLSGHPLQGYSRDVEKYSVTSYADFINNVKTKRHKQARLAGVIHARVNRRGKTGRNYSFIRFSDKSQEFETMFFSDIMDKFNEILFVGNVLIIKVDADLQGDSIRLRVNDVIQATEDDLVDTDKPDIVNDDLIRPQTEDLNREEKIVTQKYTIKISDITAIDLIAEKLELGKGSDIINLKFYDNNLKKDIKLEIGNTYSFDDDTEKYLSSIPGVVGINID
ncbi:MAG: DNA polymerase III subunit alpha [Pseudomonadota bacterium]|nr:DNA polymerase III subunit alpha [Pseudomonadota bacterium]|tara:strand:- start:1032 stop:4544 length:3513 start_codon:yes stop_codon:yes gene_type:complete